LAPLLAAEPDLAADVVFGIRAAPDSHYYLCREASTPLTGAHLAFSLWIKALCARISQSS
ncbi:MAG: hypothetical protein J0I30_06515, partial [Burkholderiales bacterium]|nr:hypothetical protein [Burkholderiales bacterium]